VQKRYWLGFVGGCVGEEMREKETGRGQQRLQEEHLLLLVDGLQDAS
jgi:hypothetical protein